MSPASAGARLPLYKQPPAGLPGASTTCGVVLPMCWFAFVAVMQGVAPEALQEAYDDLALRCNSLEVQNAKQQLELVRLSMLQCSGAHGSA